MCPLAATPLGRTCLSCVNALARTIPLSADTFPIRIVSVHLLGAAGELLRVLFLDRAGHISASPHYVPRDEALILPANQRRVLGHQARVQVH